MWGRGLRRWGSTHTLPVKAHPQKRPESTGLFSKGLHLHISKIQDWVTWRFFFFFFSCICNFFFIFFIFLFFIFFVFLPLLWAAPAAYGGSQARGRIGAVAPRPTPEPQQRRIRAASATYTTAHGNAGSLTH